MKTFQVPSTALISMPTAGDQPPKLEEWGRVDLMKTFQVPSTALISMPTAGDRPHDGLGLGLHLPDVPRGLLLGISSDKFSISFSS